MPMPSPAPRPPPLPQKKEDCNGHGSKADDVSDMHRSTLGGGGGVGVTGSEGNWGSHGRCAGVEDSAACIGVCKAPVRIGFLTSSISGSLPKSYVSTFVQICTQAYLTMVDSRGSFFCASRNYAPEASHSFQRQAMAKLSSSKKSAEGIEGPYFLYA